MLKFVYLSILLTKHLFFFFFLLSSYRIKKFFPKIRENIQMTGENPIYCINAHVHSDRIFLFISLVSFEIINSRSYILFKYRQILLIIYLEPFI